MNGSPLDILNILGNSQSSSPINLLGGLGNLFSGSGLQNLLSLIQGIALIFACMYFGSKALAGYTGSKPLILKIFASIGLGLICLIAGIVVGYGTAGNLGINVEDNLLASSFVEFGSSIFVAIALFVLLRLLSSGKSEKVKESEFKNLREIVLELKEKVERIEKTLISRGIAPKVLSEGSAFNKIKEILHDKGLKDKIEQIAAELKDEKWMFKVSCGSKKFKLIIDAYTGEEISVSRWGKGLEAIGAAFDIIKSNKKMTIGIILTILFAVYVISLNTPAAQNRITKLFNPGAAQAEGTAAQIATSAECSFTSIINNINNMQEATETEAETIVNKLKVQINNKAPNIDWDKGYGVGKLEIKGNTIYAIQLITKQGVIMLCASTLENVCECQQVQQ